MFMQRFFSAFLLPLLFAASLEAQNKGYAAMPAADKITDRPKLVVGIVVDQMRWDYLYRYYDRYGDNGFKRLLGKGFSCENTLINYLPSYTAVGHTTIFTGSVPALDGIAGNDWTEQLTGEASLTESVKGVSAASRNPERLPRPDGWSPRRSSSPAAMAQRP